MRKLCFQIAALGVGAAVFCAAALAQSQTFAPASGTGPKKTIFVGVFEAADAVGGDVTAEGMSALLTDALVKDGRFIVVERAAYSDINAEQAIGKQGQTTAETAPATGQMIGASLIVRGTVTKFNPQAGGGQVQVGGMNLFGGGVGDSLGLSHQYAEVTITLRLIDSTTGQVLSTMNADGTAASNTASADVFTKSGMEIGGQAFNNTPLGKAAQDAIRKCVQQIALVSANTPWSALVAEDSGGQVYITAGADANMQPGTTLHVYRKAKAITDPSTGVVLDTIYDNVGTIQVTQVRDKVSIASVASGNPPERGDVVKMQ